MCVAGAGPLRTARRGDTPIKNTTKSMDMDKQEEKILPAQGDRIPQGTAQGPSIVPAGPASSSYDGLDLVLPASTRPELTIAVINPKDDEEQKTCDAAKEETVVIIDPPIEKEENVVNEDPTKQVEEKEDDTEMSTYLIETASMDGSASVAMDCDEYRAAKRKISRSAERCLSDDSEEENLKRVKTNRRRRVISSVSPPKEIQSRSNPDLTQRPSEEEPRIVKMKKGYISKQKRLEIEEAKEEIADKKREEIRRRREERIKEEDEKRKREERNKAEINVMARIGNKSQCEKDYVDNMAASDLAALALEYLDHIEVIRKKCGTMQGALSGELKRRKTSLDGMVRALQAKAEENGDPLFLRNKIEELLKKNREEDDRKKREISELKEIVTNLTKENKEMRRELKTIRESLERKNEMEAPKSPFISREDDFLDTGRKSVRKENRSFRDGVRNTYRDTYPDEEAHGRPMRPREGDPAIDIQPERRRKEKDNYRESKGNIYSNTYLHDEGVHGDPTMSHGVGLGPVMRPALKGKITPIPNSSMDLKQKKDIIVKSIEKLEGMKVVIRKPSQQQPKEEERMEERRMERFQDGRTTGTEETEMEWEVNGVNWSEETDKEKEDVRDRQSYIKNDQRMEANTRREDQTWTEVVKKGKKKEKNKDRDNNVNQNSGKKNLPKLVKRKTPKTAAVSIKGDVKSGFSYAEVLRKARTQIDMDELEITAPKIRKGLNGATIIEIAGPECQNKARLLADKLQEVLREDKAAITTPTIKGQLRIVGLDESVGKEEIGWKIAEEGKCEIKEIRIGEIRRTRRGMGTVWLQCPLGAAITIADKKKIKIGWSIAGVTLLKARPLQCYRCWHYGHVKDNCRSPTDRSKCCFQCGQDDHGVKACKNSIKCMVCADLGLEHSHRLGSVKCEGVKARPSNADTVRRADDSTIKE